MERDQPVHTRRLQLERDAEPNVFYIRRGERFYDVSGISGLDFADDSRAFAITDFDNDGRPDIILKSRSARRFESSKTTARRRTTRLP